MKSHHKKSSAKPWATKQWKTMRQKKIGNRCKQCGSEKPPFVLQHLKHGEPYRDIWREKARELFSDWLKNNNLSIPYIRCFKKTCPRCHRKGYYFRKGTSDYRCQPCGEVFIHPYILEYCERDRTIAYQLYHRFMDSNKSRISIEAKKESEAQFQHYMAGVDTVTFCQVRENLRDRDFFIDVEALAANRTQPTQKFSRHREN